MDDERKRSALRYIAAAAAATAGGAALWLASEHVGFVRAALAALGDASSPVVRFYFRRGDIPGEPGLWVKYAVCLAAPAVLWAVAIARLAPRLALRLAGIIVQRWFVALVVVGAAVGVVYAAAEVLGEAPLTSAEAAHVFQSKIFCRGKAAAPAPFTEGDAARAFFRAGTDVVRSGRWFSSYPPLHAALLCLGSMLGWAKLAGLAAAVVVLISTYAIGRRLSGYFGAAVAVVLVATSPAFIFIQGSYLAEASYLGLFALALWACWRAAASPGRGALAALGAAAGAAFLTSEYTTLYLALPFAWFLAGRFRGYGAPGTRPWWLVAGAAPFLVLWALYNWRQTGNFLLPPRFFAGVPAFGFGDGYGLAAALAATARNLFALANDGFGWPLLCLVPAVARLFMNPRPGDFEKALYAAVVLTVLAHLPRRSDGLAFSSRPYYAAWFCLAFITAQFFVILAARAQERFGRAGEGAAALVLAALVAVNLVVYMPRAAARYAAGPGAGEARWADAALRRAVAALGLDDAVVIIKPRERCLSSPPGSPFLDDAVIYARDNGARNVELHEIFPGRSFYLVDYADFPRTGEIEALDFDAEE
jgi:hypothetical protein